ncbi:hypothetical protein P0L94_11145 [Microbacter sp. GSS18]|nr:hypothetical protein P0L94_11145 [Microbacter sp. GSS18]
MTPRTLIVDFDGTACIGDAPALDYAAALDVEAEGADLLRRVHAWIEDPLGAADADDALRHADDVYQAAWGIAQAVELSPERISRTYLASRARLTAGEIHAERAPGLDELSAAVRSAGGRVVLVTNAPRDGLDPILERLGMTHLFDAVVGDAGKPAGLARIIADVAGADGGEAIASIGDIWRNDLEPVRALGGRTGLIDRFALRRGPADWSAASLDGLVPAIAAWARGA